MNDNDLADVVERMVGARLREDRAELLSALAPLTVAPAEYIAGVVMVMAAEVARRMPRHEAGFLVVPPIALRAVPPFRLTLLRMAAAVGNGDPGLARDLGVTFLLGGGSLAASQLVTHALEQVCHQRTCADCAEEAGW